MDREHSSTKTYSWSSTFLSGSNTRSMDIHSISTGSSQSLRQTTCLVLKKILLPEKYFIHGPWVSFGTTELCSGRALSTQCGPFLLGEHAFDTHVLQYVTPKMKLVFAFGCLTCSVESFWFHLFRLSTLESIQEDKADGSRNNFITPRAG